MDGINVKIKSKPLVDIDSWTMLQLRRLNKGHKGRMLDYLTGRHYEVYDFRVYYITGLFGRVKSWAITYMATDVAGDRRKVDFFTDKKHRGNGYASILAQHITDIHGITYGSAKYSTLFSRYGIRDERFN